MVFLNSSYMVKVLTKCTQWKYRVCFAYNIENQYLWCINCARHSSMHLYIWAVTSLVLMALSWAGLFTLRMCHTSHHTVLLFSAEGTQVEAIDLGGGCPCFWLWPYHNVGCGFTSVRTSPLHHIISKNSTSPNVLWFGSWKLDFEIHQTFILLSGLQRKL